MKNNLYLSKLVLDRDDSDFVSEVERKVSEAMSEHPTKRELGIYEDVGVITGPSTETQNSIACIVASDPCAYFSKR